MDVKNLKNLSSVEFKNFLDSFDIILSDCDGVIWTHLEQIKGVSESLATLRKCGKIIKFISNNDSSGLYGLYEKLRKANLDLQLNDVIIPSLAIIKYLKDINFQKEIFIIGTNLIKKDFTDAGFIVADSNVEGFIETPRELFGKVKDNLNVGAVIFAFDPNLNYFNLLNVITYLKRREVILIFAADYKEITLDSNTILMGLFGIQTLIKEFSRKVPLEFGKPSLNLKNFVKEKFNIVDPQRVLFIGDSLEQDMEFASRCGYKKLLVLTGCTKVEQIDNCKNLSMLPDYFISGLADLRYLINKHVNM